MRWAEWILGVLICLWMAACGSGGGVEGDEFQGLSEAFPEVPAETLPGADSLVLQAGPDSAESPIKPWSGWWWPSRDRRILKVLEKWDRARTKGGHESHAMAFEEKELISESALTWEGHCDAWAMASLSVPEPRVPLRWGGELFSVGEQKALLVKSFERVDGKKIVGHPFRGDARSDYADISPVEFHRFLMSELFEKRRPFVLDKDPGIPVWNTPIWRAEFEIFPESSGRWRVMTWLWGADPWVDSLDQTGTKTVLLGYAYEFSGRELSNGKFEVFDGEWILDPSGVVDSRVDHPDFAVSIPVSDYNPKSRNDWLDSAEIVKAFVTGG
jgi:hypothetical protein